MCGCAAQLGRALGGWVKDEPGLRPRSVSGTVLPRPAAAPLAVAVGARPGLECLFVTCCGRGGVEGWSRGSLDGVGGPVSRIPPLANVL